MIAILFDDLLGDLVLAIQGIDGHDSPLKTQHFQPFGDGGNLIWLLFWIESIVGGDLR